MRYISRIRFPASHYSQLEICTDKCTCIVFSPKITTFTVRLDIYIVPWNFFPKNVLQKFVLIAGGGFFKQGAFVWRVLLLYFSAQSKFSLLFLLKVVDTVILGPYLAGEMWYICKNIAHTVQKFCGFKSMKQRFFLKLFFCFFTVYR